MYVLKDTRYVTISIHCGCTRLTLKSCIVYDRTVLRGSVCKIEEQICCEVEFEDGSICDSIPQSDLIVVCEH